MITPQELRDTQFDKAVFGGYDMAAVDEFVTHVASDYTALFKENAVLKNKLKLLASTVEEYRSVDEAMRKALITAQNMANEMVKNAQEKSNELIANASAIANERVSDLAAKVAEEETRLNRAKGETAAFVDGMLKAYQKQAESLAGLRSSSEIAEPDSMEDTLTLATDEINKCVQSAMENIQKFEEKAVIEDVPGSKNDDIAREIEQEIQEKKIEDLGEVEKEQEPKVSVFEVDINKKINPMSFEDIPVSKNKEAEQTKKIDFSDLKFGRNYDFDDE